MSTCASARLPSTRILTVCTPHLPTSGMTGWDSRAASWRHLALPRSIINLRTWRFTPWARTLPGASDHCNLGPTHSPAESAFSLRRPRALTASPFSLAAVLTCPSNHSFHSVSNPITCARSSTPPARTVFNSAPASCSISSSLLNRVHAAISSEGRDLSLFLLEQIFYLASSTTPNLLQCFQILDHHLHRHRPIYRRHCIAYVVRVQLPIREIQHFVRVLFPCSPQSLISQQLRRHKSRRLRMLGKIVISKHQQRPFRL